MADAPPRHKHPPPRSPRRPRPSPRPWPAPPCRGRFPRRRPHSPAHGWCSRAVSGWTWAGSRTNSGWPERPSIAGPATATGCWPTCCGPKPRPRLDALEQSVEGKPYPARRGDRHGLHRHPLRGGAGALVPAHRRSAGAAGPDRPQQRLPLPPTGRRHRDHRGRRRPRVHAAGDPAAAGRHRDLDDRAVPPQRRRARRQPEPRDGQAGHRPAAAGIAAAPARGSR